MQAIIKSGKLMANGNGSEIFSNEPRPKTAGSGNEDGDNLPFRDIDVGVYVTAMDKKESVYYGLELSERLSFLIKVPVDVRVVNFAPITFQFHVVRGQLIIDNDEDARCTFMEHVARFYLDMKPLFLRAIKEAYGNES